MCGLLNKAAILFILFIGTETIRLIEITMNDSLFKRVDLSRMELRTNKPSKVLLLKAMKNFRGSDPDIPNNTRDSKISSSNAIDPAIQYEPDKSATSDRKRVIRKNYRYKYVTKGFFYANRNKEEGKDNGVAQEKIDVLSDESLKKQISNLVKRQMNDTASLVTSLNIYKERFESEVEYQIGYNMCLLRHNKLLLDQLFNTAIQNQYNSKALEDLKIFELIMTYNVETTNLMGKIMNIHVNNSLNKEVNDSFVEQSLRVRQRQILI